MEAIRASVAGSLIGPLWVRARGSGQPMVLLHGNSQDHHAFDRVVPLLARPGRLLVGIDSRAHGRSPRGSGPLTIASMADDVASVLRATGLGAVDVLGFSDGGNIALELAIRHPWAVRSLVVCGANLHPAGLRGPVRAEVTAAYRAARALAHLRPAWGIVAERMRLMAEDPRIDAADLARVTVPVLVVAGERDIVRPEHTRAIAEALPRGELCVIAGVGHLVPERKPHDLAGRTEEFCARVRSDGGTLNARPGRTDTRLRPPPGAGAGPPP